MEEVGRVTHYFGRIGVAIVELSGELRLGDEIHIVGATTDFSQAVESMEVEHEKVEVARKGQSVGIKVAQRVREGDRVYKVRP